MLSVSPTRSAEINVRFVFWLSILFSKQMNLHNEGKICQMPYMVDHGPNRVKE